jgi:hypothetical protein
VPPERAREYTASAFSTASGAWTLVSDGDGDTGWLLRPSGAETCELAGGEALDGGRYVYPASWDNLLTMKNLVQEADPGATIFPTAGGTLHKKSLGIGARFTAMHWPAVDWAMAQLDISLTANQNSIPRELVYDVNAMLDGELDMIPFPFIGASIPEGHQGQSVEGARGASHEPPLQPPVVVVLAELPAVSGVYWPQVCRTVQSSPSSSTASIRIACRGASTPTTR